MESVQVLGCRQADQENVRELPDLRVSDQVRRVLLGWVLHPVYLLYFGKQ